MKEEQHLRQKSHRFSHSSPAATSYRPLKVMDSHVHSGSGMEIFRQKLYGLMQIIICQR